MAPKPRTAASSRISEDISPYYIHIPKAGDPDVSGGDYMEPVSGHPDQQSRLTSAGDNDEPDDTVVTENSVYNCDIARDPVQSPNNSRDSTREYLELVDVPKTSDPESRNVDVEGDNTGDYLEPINTDSQSKSDYMELGERSQVEPATYTQLPVQSYRPVYDNPDREYLALLDN